MKYAHVDLECVDGVLTGSGTLVSNEESVY